MGLQHWIVVAVFLGGLGIQLGSAHQWADVLTPGFVGGTLVQLAAVIRAFYTENLKKV